LIGILPHQLLLFDWFSLFGSSLWLSLSIGSFDWLFLSSYLVSSNWLILSVLISFVWWLLFRLTSSVSPPIDSSLLSVGLDWIGFVWLGSVWIGTIWFHLVWICSIGSILVDLNWISKIRFFYWMILSLDVVHSLRRFTLIHLLRLLVAALGYDISWINL
jgi:hypothetical protein